MAGAEVAIRIQGVSKRYRRANAQRPWTLQQTVLRGFGGLRRTEWFWALRDVSLEVSAGQMTGVIGRNGAGKSTLLHLTGRVGQPDRGTIQTHGRVGALIDLGAGYHPDLTGRENVILNGVVAGLTRREVERRFDEMVDFAELGDFIDSPLRTYSTGMQMRLAFSVAVHVDPDILLIDEVLAVGDLAFQQKCLDRIAWYKSQGCAILLVSHDMGVIRRLCDEAVWLEQGAVAARGSPSQVADVYIQQMEAETRRRTPASPQVQRLANGTELRLHDNRIGSQEMEIREVRLFNSQGEPVASLNSGGCLRVEMSYLAPQPCESPVFGVTILTEEKVVVFDAHSSLDKPTLQGKGSISLLIDRLDLTPGRYYVDVGAYRQDWEYAYDYHSQVYPLDITAETRLRGMIQPPHHWELREG